jgi:hypothetical protein
MAAPGVEVVGVGAGAGAGAGAGVGIWRGTACRLLLVACSSCMEITIGRELQLRQISKNAASKQEAASSKQPGSPHLCFSEAWSWRWLATRGGEGGAEADTNSCKS